MKKAKILDKEIVFNKYKKLIKERLEVSDGSELDWVYLDTPRSLVIVPITSKNELLLVRLYRYNLKRYVCELPAGGFEIKRKNIIEAASRELLEETGYVSGEYIDLGRYYVLPSETNRWVHVVLALSAEKKEEPQLDNMIEKHFDISTKLVNFNEVVQSIGGKKSIIKGVEYGFAILLADRYLRR